MSSPDMPTDDDLRFKLRLSIEETVENVVQYAYKDGIGWMEVGTALEKNGLTLTITLKDAGKPFNPLEKSDPDINLPLEEREIGGLGIYLCKQYCEEIPRELIESARIDGAGNFRIYWQIVLPQIRPALGALAIFTFLEYWNDYLNPLIYLSSTENMTLPLALSYFSTQHSTNLSATMAAAALIMVPAAIVFIIFQKQFIKGLALTGMK